MADKFLEDLEASLAEAAKDAPHIPYCDQGFELARALLIVLAARQGADLIEEVRKELIDRADEYAARDDPTWQADGEEVRKFANSPGWQMLKEEIGNRRDG